MWCLVYLSGADSCAAAKIYVAVSAALHAMNQKKFSKLPQAHALTACCRCLAYWS